VFCLSVAKIWCLPALLVFVDSFVDGALRETKFEYIIEQLRSSLRFIERQLLSSQPFFLLPTREPTDRPPLQLALASETAILLKGFEVWAFPVWSGACDGLFPAMLRYTRSDEVAKCYQFTISSAAHIPRDENLSPIATIHGVFLQLTPKLITDLKMIKIEDGDYVAHISEVPAVSAMIEMLGNVVNPSVGVLQKMFGMVKGQWHLKEIPPVESIKHAFTAVQQALRALDLLPSTFQLNGQLDKPTYDAIKAYWKQIPKSGERPFVFSPQILKAILDASSRLKHKSGELPSWPRSRD
jgi:hypothetical protein